MRTFANAGLPKSTNFRGTSSKAIDKFSHFKSYQSLLNQNHRGFTSDEHAPPELLNKKCIEHLAESAAHQANRSGLKRQLYGHRHNTKNDKTIGKTSIFSWIPKKIINVVKTIKNYGRMLAVQKRGKDAATEAFNPRETFDDTTFLKSASHKVNRWVRWGIEGGISILNNQDITVRNVVRSLLPADQAWTKNLFNTSAVLIGDSILQVLWAAGKDTMNYAAAKPDNFDQGQTVEDFKEKQKLLDNQSKLLMFKMSIVKQSYYDLPGCTEKKPHFREKIDESCLESLSAEKFYKTLDDHLIDKGPINIQDRHEIAKRLHAISIANACLSNKKYANESSKIYYPEGSLGDKMPQELVDGIEGEFAKIRAILEKNHVSGLNEDIKKWATFLSSNQIVLSQTVEWTKQFNHNHKDYKGFRGRWQTSLSAHFCMNIVRALGSGPIAALKITCPPIGILSHTFMMLMQNVAAFPDGILENRHIRFSHLKNPQNIMYKSATELGLQFKTPHLTQDGLVELFNETNKIDKTFFNNLVTEFKKERKLDYLKTSLQDINCLDDYLNWYNLNHPQETDISKLKQDAKFMKQVKEYYLSKAPELNGTTYDSKKTKISADESVQEKQISEFLAIQQKHKALCTLMYNPNSVRNLVSTGFTGHLATTKGIIGEKIGKMQGEMQLLVLKRQEKCLKDEKNINLEVIDNQIDALQKLIFKRELLATDYANMQTYAKELSDLNYQSHRKHFTDAQRVENQRKADQLKSKIDSIYQKLMTDKFFASVLGKNSFKLFLKDFSIKIKKPEAFISKFFVGFAYFPFKILQIESDFNEKAGVMSKLNSITQQIFHADEHAHAPGNLQGAELQAFNEQKNAPLFDNMGLRAEYMLMHCSFTSFASSFLFPSNFMTSLAQALSHTILLTKNRYSSFYIEQMLSKIDKAIGHYVNQAEILENNNRDATEEVQNIKQLHTAKRMLALLSADSSIINQISKNKNNQSSKEEVDELAKQVINLSALGVLNPIENEQNEQNLNKSDILQDMLKNFCKDVSQRYGADKSYNKTQATQILSEAQTKNLVLELTQALKNKDNPQSILDKHNIAKPTGIKKAFAESFKHEAGILGRFGKHITQKEINARQALNNNSTRLSTAQVVDYAVNIEAITDGNKAQVVADIQDHLQKNANFLNNLQFNYSLLNEKDASLSKVIDKIYATAQQLENQGKKYLAYKILDKCAEKLIKENKHFENLSLKQTRLKMSQLSMRLHKKLDKNHQYIDGYTDSFGSRAYFRNVNRSLGVKNQAFASISFWAKTAPNLIVRSMLSLPMYLYQVVYDDKKIMKKQRNKSSSINNITRTASVESSYLQASKDSEASITSNLTDDFAEQVLTSQAKESKNTAFELLFKNLQIKTDAQYYEYEEYFSKKYRTQENRLSSNKDKIGTAVYTDNNASLTQPLLY